VATLARILAVTFDVGGTLIRPWPSVGHVYAEVALRHGVTHVTADLLEARFRAAWRARHDLNDTRAGWQALVDDVFRGLTREPPSRTFFPELYERFAQAEAWRIFDDVLPAIRELSARGLRLGVLSNWDERLRSLLRNLRLDACFQTLVISSEVGAAKPAPAIFAQAASQLGLPPASILHVGDDLEMDVLGATSAGFHAFHLARTAQAGDARTLTHLGEIATRIGALEAKSD
jgi:putative hydrolase of the HAD superfamily